MEDSELPASAIRAAHLARESVTASSSEATVPSKEDGRDSGESPILPALLPLLCFGEKILSMPSLPAIPHFIKLTVNQERWNMQKLLG